MCCYHNVIPEAIFVVYKKRYDQSRGLMKLYTPTNVHDLIWFCFQDVLNLRKKENTTPHYSAIHL